MLALRRFDVGLQDATALPSWPLVLHLHGASAPCNEPSPPPAHPATARNMCTQCLSATVERAPNQTVFFMLVLGAMPVERM